MKNNSSGNVNVLIAASKYLGMSQVKTPERGENEALMDEYLKTQDQARKIFIKQKLVRQNVKLAFHVARKFHAKSSPEDLIQEGLFGMMKGIESECFDSSKSSFVTWICPWIRAYIYNYIFDNFGLVKRGANLDDRKLFWKFNKEFNKLLAKDIVPTDEKLSEVLGVRIEKVKEFRANLGGDVSDIVLESMEDNLEGTPSSLLEKEETSKLIRDKINESVAKMNYNQQQVFKFRIDRPKEEQVTLDDLGKNLRITKQRVQQIEEEVLVKLNKSLACCRQYV